jgi:hypothetical protein
MMAKLVSPLSGIPSSSLKNLSHQLNSSTEIIWENAFSTEFKHKDIVVKGTTASMEGDTA